MENETKITGPIGETFVIKQGEPLKNMINRKTLHDGALRIQSVYKPFQVEDFVNSILDDAWDNLELKARGRQITLNLGKYLPSDYKAAIDILKNVAASYKSGIFVLGFSFPDFVEVYGQDENNWDISINALETFTSLWSSEMAVRPFILKYEQRMMSKMLVWAKHKNEHIRRLASEGCRPALPWAIALPKFKKDPTPILPILEQLKSDPSLYVRKSVANNLNDISKTRPDVTFKIASEWHGQNEYTNWIVKHGCRTLLKKGDRNTLFLFGLNENSVVMEAFSLNKSSITIGEELNFSFTIYAEAPTKIRLEYVVGYIKSSGKISRKIFKISEILLKENERKCYTRNHSFKNLSTRKHYPGVHSLSIVINGVEQEKIDFEVKANS